MENEKIKRIKLIIKISPYVCIISSMSFLTTLFLGIALGMFPIIISIILGFLLYCIFRIYTKTGIMFYAISILIVGMIGYKIIVNIFYNEQFQNYASIQVLSLILIIYFGLIFFTKNTLKTNGSDAT